MSLAWGVLVGTLACHGMLLYCGMDPILLVGTLGLGLSARSTQSERA